MCLQLGIFPRGHLCAAVSRDTLSTRTLTSPALPSRVHSSRAPDGRATRPVHTARWLATQEPSQHGQGRKRGAHRAPRWREASQHVTPEDPKVPRDLSTGGRPGSRTVEAVEAVSQSGGWGSGVLSQSLSSRQTLRLRSGLHYVTQTTTTEGLLSVHEPHSCLSSPTRGKNLET